MTGTVWDVAEEVAERERERIRTAPKYTADQIQAAMAQALPEYRGLGNKSWLFLWVGGRLWECGGDIMRQMMAVAKCGTMADEGGLIFGLRVTGWRTPTAKMHHTVILAVGGDYLDHLNEDDDGD